MMVLFKFRFPFKCTGKNKKKREERLVDVNEEYIAAHRTKSYIEIINKVESQRRRCLERLTSSVSLSIHTHLSDYVLEPRQETLLSITEGSNLHPLIIAYFHASFEACNKCGLILQSVHQVRNNYKIIQTVINLTSEISDRRSYKSAQFKGIFDELALFTILTNPMKTIKQGHFGDIHYNHRFLLRRLTKKLKVIRRKAKFTRYCKKIVGYTVVCASIALLIALFTIAIHAMVGIFAAPGVIACSFGLVKKNKLKNKELKRSLNERLGTELEVAAKGLFIMINEFDTMSRLVKRLQDEIEHIKTIANMCVDNGKYEVLIEVIKEFRINQTCFLEQLEELEEHIYLCFLTINRSRMLVVQEIMVLQKN